jgi:organic hydroperoxide reductase OsmC/OhrA
MKITAHVKNSGHCHDVTVHTEGVIRSIAVPPKANAQGSSVNGGEFLMLALATCYCNDLYREAARIGITVTSLEVKATAYFEGVGLAAKNIQYQARIESPARAQDIAILLKETDAVAEVQNTLRGGAAVELVPWST